MFDLNKATAAAQWACAAFLATAATVMGITAFYNGVKTCQAEWQMYQMKKKLAEKAGKK